VAPNPSKQKPHEKQAYSKSEGMDASHHPEPSTDEQVQKLRAELAATKEREELAVRLAEDADKRQAEAMAQVAALQDALKRETKRADDEYARVEKLHISAELGEKLVNVLIAVAGDHGHSEGAVECAKRIISERDTLKARVSVLESAAESPPFAVEGGASDRAKELVGRVAPHERELLLGDLLVLLSIHAGEEGANETATDVLRRKVTEAAMVRLELENLTKSYTNLIEREKWKDRENTSLRGALVARRAPDAGAGELLRRIYNAIVDSGPVESVAGAQDLVSGMFPRIITEWRGLRGFLSPQPMVAVAVRDDSTETLAERYSLILMEWDGKHLSPTVLEEARPWADLVRLLQHTVSTRLVPPTFR
jgi:hypothetical protein